MSDRAAAGWDPSRSAAGDRNPWLVAIVLGGGYAASTLRTAELHAIVFEEAAARWRRERER